MDVIDAILNKLRFFLEKDFHVIRLITAMIKNVVGVIYYLTE